MESKHTPPLTFPAISCHSFLDHFLARELLSGSLLVVEDFKTAGCSPQWEPSEQAGVRNAIIKKAVAFPPVLLLIIRLFNDVVSTVGGELTQTVKILSCMLEVLCKTPIESKEYILRIYVLQ
jgi:hypothetical protein